MNIRSDLNLAAQKQTSIYLTVTMLLFMLLLEVSVVALRVELSTSAL